MTITSWPTVTIAGLEMQFRVREGPYPVDSDGIEWQMTKLDGWWGVPSPETSRLSRPGGHGAYRSPAFTGARILSLEGVATAPSTDLIRQVEDRILAIGMDPDSLYEFAVDEPPVGWRYCLVERDAATMTSVRTPYSVTFSLQFAAPDPRKYGEWGNFDAELNPGPVGGLDMTAPGASMSDPGADMGTASPEGTTTVTVGGTAPVGPIIQFTGPVPQPRAYATDLGVGVQFLGELAAGQVLYVNTGDSEATPPGSALPIPARSATIDGQAQDPNLLITGGFPILTPGSVTSWAFTAASYEADALMRIHVRNGWW